MELNIHDLDNIWREVAENNWLSKSDYDEIRDDIIRYLQEKNIVFWKWTKCINSLQQLSTNFCQHVNEGFSENENISKLEFEFKRKVSLLLWADRIISLWEILSKIQDLDYWSPTTLEAIWRTKQRPNDVNNRYQNYVTPSEKREIMAIYTWIKKQIRTNDWKSIDWDSIIENLKIQWFEEIAIKFKNIK